MELDKKNHWETVYQTKSPSQVSWTQKVPQTSLDFIQSFGLAKSSSIIDIGGGDSNLVDHLLAAGFVNLTVLDISAKALERAKERLGEKAELVSWIVSDINDFTPDTSYDVWHDRAAFHFLTNPEQIRRYKESATQATAQFMCIGTFSNKGPLKCSGLEISQYSEADLAKAFETDFDKIDSLTEDHTTPFDTVQNFTFCSFKKRKGSI